MASNIQRSPFSAQPSFFERLSDRNALESHLTAISAAIQSIIYIAMATFVGIGAYVLSPGCLSVLLGIVTVELILEAIPRGIFAANHCYKCYIGK